MARRYEIDRIPGNKSGREPNVRRPRGFNHTQRYRRQDPPCEKADFHAEQGRCPVQLTFHDGQPYIRFCTDQGTFGPVVAVDSAQDAVRVGRDVCECWEESGSFERCIPKAKRKGQIKLGATNLDLDLGYGEPDHMGLSGRLKARPPRRFKPLLGKTDWISCRRVGKLTAAKKKALPAKAFGLPESRSYPMPDPAHAKNAKARAKQMLNKKKLSRKDYDRIVRKADRVINHCKRGR